MCADCSYPVGGWGEIKDVPIRRSLGLDWVDRDKRRLNAQTFLGFISDKGKLPKNIYYLTIILTAAVMNLVMDPS